MNHSLLTADRRTHLKVVVVALVCAILVVGAGIAAHLHDGAATPQVNGAVVKAGKPATYTGRGDQVVR